MSNFARIGLLTLTVSLAMTLGAKKSSADEGMWLFNDLPREYLKSRYGFEPTDAWAKHIMLSSVRFNSGGSGSFVSSNGLVLTNHHVASETLFKVSTADKNIVEDGFLAKTQADEIPAPDLELNVLVSVEDVTEKVNAVVTEELSAEEASKSRQAVMSDIESASLKDTGLRSDVITLYGGARYHLYRYKKYTDVRVVWAPEASIAFFGGDADNFEYPRFCLDVALFRVYENGKPAQIEHFLRWASDDPEEEDLVFVSGNPGRTQRIFTVAALKHLRDHRLPYVMNLLRRREIMLQQFGYEGEEQARRAKDDRFGVENSRKAYTGMIRGLQDPGVMQLKANREARLLAAVDQRPELAGAKAAWQNIDRLQDRKLANLGQVSSFRSQLYDVAETLVLLAAEDQLESADRLREFRASNRDSLEQSLFSPAPIFEDLERVVLADELARMVEKRGGDDPLVLKVLAGQSPQNRAAELVAGTQLADVEFRRELAAGGKDAILASKDPFIMLARDMEAFYREMRAEREEIAELERQAYAKIAEALVTIEGTSTYPDATFTLRLAFGPVRGYVEDGQSIPAWTTMGAAFEHEANHGVKAPWVLPESWQKASERIKSETPFNFVCTADIIGGNSGSPVVNRKGEFVGIIFDGNIQSLTSDYLYSDEQARAVSVHGAAIREALSKIYGAEALANELGH